MDGLLASPAHGPFNPSKGGCKLDATALRRRFKWPGGGWMHRRSDADAPPL